jgi:hypothetical protein
MVYISEIYFCMVKSGNLSTIFTIFYKQNDRVAMATHYPFSVQARIQTVANMARATVRFFPHRIFRGSPFLDAGLNILRIFKKYLLVICRAKLSKYRSIANNLNNIFRNCPHINNMDSC